MTERNCATPNSKLKSRIAVHTVISAKSVCPSTAQFHNTVRNFLLADSSVSQGVRKWGNT